MNQETPPAEGHSGAGHKSVSPARETLERNRSARNSDSSSNTPGERTASRGADSIFTEPLDSQVHRNTPTMRDSNSENVRPTPQPSNRRPYNAGALRTPQSPRDLFGPWRHEPGAPGVVGNRNRLEGPLRNMGTYPLDSDEDEYDQLPPPRHRGASGNFLRNRYQQHLAAQEREQSLARGEQRNTEAVRGRRGRGSAAGMASVASRRGSGTVGAARPTSNASHQDSARNTTSTGSFAHVASERESPAYNSRRSSNPNNPMPTGVSPSPRDVSVADIMATAALDVAAAGTSTPAANTAHTRNASTDLNPTPASRRRLIGAFSSVGNSDPASVTGQSQMAPVPTRPEAQRNLVNSGNDSPSLGNSPRGPVVPDMSPLPRISRWGPDITPALSPFPIQDGLAFPIQYGPAIRVVNLRPAGSNAPQARQQTRGLGRGALAQPEAARNILNWYIEHFEPIALTNPSHPLDDECSICREPFDTSSGAHMPVRIRGVPGCDGHIFGNRCIIEWLTSNRDNANSCPMDRTPLGAPIAPRHQGATFTGHHLPAPVPPTRETMGASQASQALLQDLMDDDEFMAAPDQRRRQEGERYVPRTHLAYPLGHRNRDDDSDEMDE